MSSAPLCRAERPQVPDSLILTEKYTGNTGAI